MNKIPKMMTGIINTADFITFIFSLLPLSLSGVLTYRPCAFHRDSIFINTTITIKSQMGEGEGEQD